MNVKPASDGNVDSNDAMLSPGASRPCRVFLYVVTAGTLLYILAILCGVWQSALSWLTFLYFLSYVKLLITLSKYAPQVSIFSLSLAQGSLDARCVLHSRTYSIDGSIGTVQHSCQMTQTGPAQMLNDSAPRVAWVYQGTMRLGNTTNTLPKHMSIHSRNPQCRGHTCTYEAVHNLLYLPANF